MASSPPLPALQPRTSAVSTRPALPFSANFIGGRWVDCARDGARRRLNPATGEVIAKAPLSTRADVDAAVAAAKAAFPAWRATPVAERARAMFAFKNRARGALRRARPHRDDRARQDARRVARLRAAGIENVEVACGMPSLMMGSGLEDIARGHRLRRPPPADGRLRRDRAVQLPGHGAALVPAVRDRDRQHVRREAVRAGAALAEAHLRAPRRRACRPAS